MVNEIAWYFRASKCEACDQLKDRIAKDFLKNGIVLIFMEATEDAVEEAMFFPFLKIHEVMFYSFYDASQIIHVSNSIKGLKDE